MRKSLTFTPTLAVVSVVTLLLAGAQRSLTSAPAQATRTVSLQTAAGLQLVNVTAAPGTLDGKRGVRVTMSPEAMGRIQGSNGAQPTTAAQAGGMVEQLAIVDGVDFGDGTIDVELAGIPDTTTFKDARGFVGMAFRVQPDLKTYDAFYLRPTNGRSEDQLRRNHSAQYISHPAWTWSRLRTETPGLYESYVDLVPNAWTKLRIEVRGTQALLFVHDQSQPTLVVNDLKSGPTARGGVALWLDIGTTAHFRHLTVRPAR